MLSLSRGIFFLLWLRRKNILGFWVNPMTLGLSDCLLRGILRLEGGLLPFALLSLGILTLVGDLARALSNFSYWDGIRDSRRLLRSFRGINRDLQISGGYKIFSGSLQAESVGTPTTLKALSHVMPQ